MESMIAWIAAFLVALMPQVASVRGETPSGYRARVQHIVEDAAGVALAESEVPHHTGPWGRERGLMRTLAVAWHESMGFHRDVDSGVIRGDGGKSVCLMGIMTDGGHAEGYTISELVNDRRACFSVGFHRMRLSYRTCRTTGLVGLSAYASGNCQKGRKESADMVRMGDRWTEALIAAWKRGEWGSEVHPQGDTEWGH